MKVFINPGHGYPDPGAVNYQFNLTEEQVAFEVGDMLEEYLKVAGVQVVGNLQSDDLCKVVDEANASGANLFVSIHCNSYSNPNAEGTEVLVYQLGGKSEVAAESILYQIIAELGTVDRGVKERPRLYVLNRTDMPAVLVEMAFISNEDDIQLLLEKREEFAKAIARGITDYQLQVE